jgi:hypothetical protein
MSQPLSGLLLGAVLGGNLLAASWGCNKVREASADQVAAASTATAPGGASSEGANYAVKLVVTGPCHKGQTCTADVIIQAKGDYHMNDKYPYKFKTHDPPPSGLTYPKPVVGRDDGQFEEKRGVLKVPFVADAAGDKTVGGTLSFSVCSSQNCLMDKQALETTVKVD